MFSRLLVGLDGSPGADAALAIAIELAHRFQSTLLLTAITDVRVLEAPLFGAGPMWAEGMPVAPAVAELGTVLEARADTLLAAASAKAADAGVAFEAARASGLVDQELLRLAEQVDAIVIGRRGELHERPGTVGSVTAHIIQHASIPVVVAGETDSVCRRPVVAYDGGLTSSNALALAARFASATGVPVDVVHVGDGPVGDALLLSARDYLRSQTVPCTIHRLTGDVAITIATHVAQSGADLLFAGAHGGRQERRLFVGSHALKLLKVTPVPTVIVR